MVVVAKCTPAEGMTGEEAVFAGIQEMRTGLGLPLKKEGRDDQFSFITARKGKCSNKRKIKDFAIKRTICNVLGIELVAAALFVDPIKYLVHAFLVVFVLGELLLY